MIKPHERRGHTRYPARGLVVELNGRAYPPLDVSTGGLSIEAEGLQCGQALTVKLASTDDPVDGVFTAATVVRRHGFVYGLRFTRPSFPVLRFVVSHIGGVTGATPFIFRRAETYRLT